jgi:hypothetical protein
MIGRLCLSVTCSVPWNESRLWSHGSIPRHWKGRGSWSWVVHSKCIQRKIDSTQKTLNRDLLASNIGMTGSNYLEFGFMCFFKWFQHLWTSSPSTFRGVYACLPFQAHTQKKECTSCLLWNGSDVSRLQRRGVIELSGCTMPVWATSLEGAIRKRPD